MTGFGFVMADKRTFRRQVFIYCMLAFLRVMIPVAGLSAIVLVISLFRTGKAAEVLRCFDLLFFLGGLAVAVLRIIVTSVMALVRTKLQERNNKDSGAGQIF
jgi:hypothetical protein